MEVKAGILDRIEQSFFLFKNNFKEIFITYFIYKFIVVFIISNILYFLVFNFFDINSLFNGGNGIKNSADLFGNTYFIIGVNVFLILFLLNLIFIVPFILGVIKSIKNAYENKKIDVLGNIKYGFLKLYESFRTYWYMFAYVALIPLIILIIGGSLFLFGQIGSIDNIMLIGSYISGFGIFLLIIFSAYRGLKTTFAIFRAVDYDDYSKESFIDSVKITDNNWWRIVGNFLLAGLLISIISGIINSIIGIFKFASSNFDYSLLMDGMNGKINADSINKIVGEFTQGLGTVSFSSLSFDLIDLIIKTIFTVFMFVFIYVFYKRLELEYKGSTDDKNDNYIEENNIEL